MPAEPMAEQVAGDDPAIAANNAQANTLATPSPPGTRCSQACSAEYKSWPARDLPIAAPFRMKSGIDNSVIDAISSYGHRDAGLLRGMASWSRICTHSRVMPEAIRT